MYLASFSRIFSCNNTGDNYNGLSLVECDYFDAAVLSPLGENERTKVRQVRNKSDAFNLT